MRASSVLDLGVKIALALREGERDFAAWLVRQHDAREAGVPFDEPAPVTECDRRLVPFDSKLLPPLDPAEQAAPGDIK